MVAIKSFFGIVLAAAALYFLKNAVRFLSRTLARPDLAFGIVAVALGGCGHRARRRSPDLRRRWLRWRRSARRVGIVASVAGLFLLVGWLEAAARPAFVGSLRRTRGAHRAESRAAPHAHRLHGRLVRRLQRARAHHLLPTHRSWPKRSRFVAVKVDATHEDDPSVDEVKDRYRVVGLPTVVCSAATGASARGFTEFVGPERFLSAIPKDSTNAVHSGATRARMPTRARMRGPRSRAGQRQSIAEPHTSYPCSVSDK